MTTKTHDHQPPSKPRSERARPVLIVAYPRSVATPLPTSGEAIGRSWLAAIGSPDSEVSSRHAAFTRTKLGITIADAGSRNGTFVDGVRLDPGEEVALHDGAIVRLGRTLLIYRQALQGPLDPSPDLGKLVSPFGLREVERAVAAWTAKPPETILVLGETGSGKELLSAALAERLRPAAGGGASVTLNLTAIPAGVFEAQLFGHTAGAFSDAKRASRGAVGAAEGGALLLDEIGDMPLDLQPKLLRLIENREVQPVGSERPHKADVLLIAATHRALDAMVDAGTFRRDLHARLSSAVVRLPPLRERTEDVFAIAAALTRQAGVELGPDGSASEVEAVERLLLAPWPGNVRELAATLARARLRDPEPGFHLWSIEAELGSLGPRSQGRALVRERVERALSDAAGNESEAARALGCSRGALRRFLGKA